MDIRLGGSAAGPLAGLRILDFSTAISGPFCAQILGDLGADVLKIEAPGGDGVRGVGPPFKDGLSAIFVQFNRNKRSAVLDLKKPAAVAVVRRLARGADGVVHNCRPGVMERLGLGYADLAPENPRLVYLGITGFGRTGPYADQPAYDNIIQGHVGQMVIQGQFVKPELVRNTIADKSTALSATYAFLAALYARERTGLGQEIDVSMIDAFAAFMQPDGILRNTFLPDAEWQGLPDISVVHRVWPTADGHVLIMFVEQHQWEALCKTFDEPELAADPRFNSVSGRFMNWAAFIEAVEAALCRWRTADLVERARRFSAPLAPANCVADFLAHPQVAANGTVFEVPDRGDARIRYLKNPAGLRETPPSFRRHAPRLGEHTDAILAEAGLSADEIAALRAAGVAS